jgi:hypothetical protein
MEVDILEFLKMMLYKEKAFIQLLKMKNIKEISNKDKKVGEVFIIIMIVVFMMDNGYQIYGTVKVFYFTQVEINILVNFKMDT